MIRAYRKLSLVLLLFSLVLSGLFSFGGSAPVYAEGETALSVTALEGQLTLADLQALNDGKAVVYSHNDRVTFVDGKCSDKPVRSMDDAADVVLSMVGLLGGNDKTQFIPWRSLTDTFGSRYYVFKQLYAGTTVMGGAVKVITDAEGNMIGLSSSIETDLPEIDAMKGITAEEAVQIVIRQAEENDRPVPAVFEDLTDKMILPVILSLDIDDEEAENASRFVWVVYTDNPESNVNHSSELPYLAHYVTMDGEYLYSLETIMPGDAASSTGFDTEYVFEFMEPVDYTGYVDLSDGTEKEITVTVMRDKRTGMYYLGNIERKIVVAKCWDFLYGGGRVVLESSPDNLEWDQVGLLSLYNYCRAYDYYKAIGWNGGDGLGTPILILNDFQDESHVQVDNAAFIGNYLGWSMFLTSYANDLSQCLDVIAHEFTHCVTDAVMTYNSYMNDFGAINEAMSDIQGKICEIMAGDTAGSSEESAWTMGYGSLTPVRSMSNPHLYGQPAFSWDLYYKPKVQTPTVVNDYGGVHSNSSLLNVIAYRLIKDGGMSPEEARAYWFAVDCTMVPGTDYPQLSELLPWVLRAAGMEQYMDVLLRAMDEVRLASDTLPDSFDDNRALVTLTLPDNENFTNGNWMMNYFSIDVHGFAEKAANIINLLASGDYTGLPKALQDMLKAEEPVPTAEPEAEDESFLGELFGILSLLRGEYQPTPTPVPMEKELSLEEQREISSWVQDQLAEVVYSSMTHAGQDGRTIQLVTIPGRTIPLLLYISFTGSSAQPDHMIPVVYMNDRWYELPDLMDLMVEGKENQGLMDDEKVSQLVNDLTSRVISNFGKIRSLDDALDLITIQIEGGEVYEIPAVGLEGIVIPETPEKAENLVMGSPEDNIPPRKSRPKTD